MGLANASYEFGLDDPIITILFSICGLQYVSNNSFFLHIPVKKSCARFTVIDTWEFVKFSRCGLLSLLISRHCGSSTVPEKQDAIKSRGFT